MRSHHLALPFLVLGAFWISGCGSSSPAAPPPCTANSVFVVWDSPMDASNTAVDQTVTGFYVYVGTGPQAYDRKIRVDVTAPVVASYQQEVSGLGLGTYDFTVTAFNEIGESIRGNAVSWSFPVCGVQAHGPLGIQ
jgi:hypothetical protein